MFGFLTKWLRNDRLDASRDTRPTDRRDFLGSVLRFGIGLAAMQLGALATPSDVAAEDVCEGCFGCECCTTPNYWLECEPSLGACPGGGGCWPTETFTHCCDYVCPNEGFCCVNG